MQYRRPNISKADKVARDVLLELGMTGPESFPLNVEQVAKDQGIRIIYADLGEIQAWSDDVDPELDGFFYRPKAVMMVRNDRPPTRQRFTIAHELGHFRLHPHLETDFVKRNSLSASAMIADEMEANRFAASLLMPVDRMKPLLEKRTSVEDIAKRFQVSPAAAFNRADALLRELKLPYYLRKD